MNAILEMRLKLGLTQTKMAALLKIPGSSLHHYETDKRHPRLGVAYTILEFAQKNGMKLTLEDIYPR